MKLENAVVGWLAICAVTLNGASGANAKESSEPSDGRDDAVEHNAQRMIREGRHTFRFDTFGSQAFFGGELRLHEAIEGKQYGGVGPGVSPRTALAVGLKVDVDALPRELVRQLRRGEVDLDDVGVTLALLRLNAVVGITGFFNDQGTLQSVGIQCALCHSTVNDSLLPGIGRRLDAWAARDLNVGAIFALSPDLSA